MAVIALTACAGLGCKPVVSGVDPEPLGYGLGGRLDSLSGYDPDPVPRATPSPWMPPERDVNPALDFGGAAGAPEARGPSPYVADVVAVCGHLDGLANPDSLAGSNADKLDAQLLCLRRYRVARVFRTIGDWKTLVACVNASASLAEAKACEATTPAAFVGVEEYPRESALCFHVFALTIIEEVGLEPMLSPPELLEFQPLLGECVEAFVGEERDDHNPSEYDELLSCIETSDSLAAADACN